MVLERISNSCCWALDSGGKTQHIPYRFILIRLYEQFAIEPDECFAECYLLYFGSHASFAQESIGVSPLSFEIGCTAIGPAHHIACSRRSTGTCFMGFVVFAHND